MNMETGTFTAPITGVYGFTFTAHFVCESEDRFLHVKFNGQYGGIIHFCRLDTDDYFPFYKAHLNGGNTVHFSRNMYKGDRLEIDSGSAHVWMGKISACFSGSLLKKN